MAVWHVVTTTAVRVLSFLSVLAPEHIQLKAGAGYAGSSRAALPAFNASFAWLDPHVPVEQRIADLVAAMSLEEKISRLSNYSPAIQRLNLTAYNWQNECLHGIKEESSDGKGATVFPQPLGIAASFDEGLMLDMAGIISDEARAKDNEQYAKTGTRRMLNCWTPNLNIFRDPRWGRGSETYGEDPHLTARMTVSFVKGVQGTDPSKVKVGATCKHWAAYSVEGSEGYTQRSFEAVISARDFHDTYSPAFEACVNEGKARAVMCAYNSVNGVPACANTELLDKTLRGAWNYSGLVVSDCGAVEAVFHEHKYSKTMTDAMAMTLKAGTDMICGEYTLLKDAAAQKLVAEADIDTALTRVLRGSMEFGLFDDPKASPYADITTDVIGSAAHLTKAKEAAQKSIVLLKNRDLGNSRKRLPLDKAALKKVVVLGPMATSSEYLLGNYYGRPEGPVPTPLDVIKAKLGADKVELNLGARVSGFDTNGLDGAVDSCAAADLCLFFLGTTALMEHVQPGPGYDMWSPIIESEGKDRRNIDLPGMQETLVKAVARRTDTPIVVVLIHGGPLDVQWLQESDRVDAILTAWFPGQGAEAIADTLVGDAAPAGRLPVTFYYNNYTRQQVMTEMDMRKFPGRTYRFTQVPVLYPFGYGLSYSTFSYNGLQSSSAASVIDPQAQTVSLVVTNTGPVDSDHVVLLFVSPGRQLAAQHAEHGLPVSQLAGFTRLHLKAGAEAPVSFQVAGKLFHHALSEEAETQLLSGEWLLQVGDVSQTTSIRPSIGSTARRALSL